MATSAFAKLREKSKQMAELTEKIKKDSAGGGGDDRYWKLSVNKEDVGSAVLRFLPAPDGEEFPYVKKYSHMFELPKAGSKNWFQTICPSTWSEEGCPICDMNNDAWNNGGEAGQNLARYRKRNISYIANVYVIDDPAKPENNGKVFLFEFGQRIFQKIEASMTPEFADIQAINPFDMWGTGANFKLRARKLDGQRSYDLSTFDTPAEFLGTDEEREAVWKQQFALAPEIGKEKYTGHTEVLAKFNKMSGISAASTPSFAAQTPAPAPAPAPAPVFEDVPDATAPAPAPAPSPAPVAAPVAAPAASSAGSLADKYRAMVKK